jgi:hypothetical protein
VYDGSRKFVLEHRIKKASKVAMKPLVTGDQLVRKCEPGHESSLLQPKDGTKRAREENALNCSESDQPFGKRSAVIDPTDGPFSLLLDARYSFDRVEKSGSFGSLFHISVNKKRISL